MAKRIGIFADVSNLYYCLQKRYKRKLNYEKYYSYIKDLGEVTQAVAYGAQMNDEAKSFIQCLTQIGYIAKFTEPKTYQNDTVVRRKADFDVKIAVDIIEMLERLDLVILGSADGDFVPLVEYIRRKGVDVIVIACGVSRDLKEVASRYVEIPESLLER